MTRQGRFACSLAALISVGSSSHGQADFVGLGFLTDWKTSSAAAVSADGRCVVGWSNIDISWSHAYRWTAEEGMIDLGDLPGDINHSSAADVSDDGSVIVGFSQVESGPQAFRWTPEEGMVAIGPPPHESFSSQAYGVSGDGRFMVGVLDEKAFVWTPETDLYLLPGAGSTFAVAISHDGRRVVGSCYAPSRTASVWVDGGDPVFLGDLPGGNKFSAAGAISADGAAVTGISESDVGLQTFLWTQESGMVALADLAGCQSPSGGGIISDDGRAIVARSFWACGLPEACRWTRIDGIHGLKSLLLDAGAKNVQGWTLEFASDVSADGTVIVGQGTNPEGNQEAWVARLPLPCIADADGDGMLDLADFIAFQQHFVLGELAADCDANWTLDFFDYLCFLNEFNESCS